MQPFSEEIKLTVEVTGIYGLAEDWIMKMEDPVEQAFQYDVKVAGAVIKGGKMMAKADSEESKADEGSVKDKKAAPAKGKPAAVAEPEELTPEE